MLNKAVRMHGQNDLRLDTFELPEIKDNEILVKVISDSICMSSYKAAIQGSNHKRVPDDIDVHPAIVGHEFCGVIEQVGAKWADKFTPGEKLTIQPNISYRGTMQTPGYAFEFCGGDSQYAVLLPEVMEQDCLLKYRAKEYFYGSLSEPLSCIIGTSSVAQLESNLAALDHLTFSEEEMERINNIINISQQLGLSLRALYGDDKEVVGNLFQVSNQLTLGFSEQEILDNVKSAVTEIIAHERRARKALSLYMKEHLEDGIWRAYGTLRYARLLTEKEVLTLFSKVRLGIDMRLFYGRFVFGISLIHTLPDEGIVYLLGFCLLIVEVEFSLTDLLCVERPVPRLNLRAFRKLPCGYISIHNLLHGVALIDKISERLAGIARVIAINCNASTIVGVLLQNLTSKPSAEDEKVLNNQFFVNYDILCAYIILCSHKHIECRLCICKYLFIAVNNST